MNKNLYKLLSKCFVLVLSLFYSGTGFAQKPWTLEQCVKYAIENNITLKQQKLNVNYNDNLLLQSKIDLAPSLNARFGHNFISGKSTGEDNTTIIRDVQKTTFDAGIDVTLFNGLSKLNTIKLRKIELESSIQDLEKAKDDIALAVVSAYLEILFNKELVNISKDQLEVTNQQIEHNAQLVKAGELAKGKLLETQAQKADEELTLTNYENELSLSLLNLMQLLDLNISDSFDIVLPDFDPVLLSTKLSSSNEVYNAAVFDRPEIKSKELMVQKAMYDTKIAKAQRYPYLTASVSYGNYYNNTFRYDNGVGPLIPLSEQLDLNGQKIAGLTLSIPIFNGYNVETNIKNSRIGYENSNYDLQLAKNNLRKEIEQVHQNAVAAMKRYYSSERAVKSTEEAFRYVEEKFNLGIVTPLEYTESKNKVTNAQSSFIQAKYEYIFRVKILDFYMGKDITL